MSGGYEHGGLIGNSHWAFTDTITGAYWDTETTGQHSSAGGEGKTTAQLMDPATFAGWDIATTGGSTAVWRIYEGQTRPLLRSFLTPLTVTAADISKTYDDQVVGAFSNAQYSVAGADTSGHVFGTSDPYGGAVNVGTYAPVPVALWSDQRGYDISFSGGALTINPALVTVSGITAASKIYDGTTTATLDTSAHALEGRWGATTCFSTRASAGRSVRLPTRTRQRQDRHDQWLRAHGRTSATTS